MRTTLASRKLLSGVPKIHFYQGGPACPEDVCLPSVMRALMEYLGEADFGCHTCRSLPAACPIACSYAYFMGISGAMSCISWQHGWSDDNVAISYVAADPWAPERASFRAAGYQFEALGRPEGQAQEALVVQRVKDSIAAGMPVVAYGIAGPPEPGLITGYDEDGAVAIGWSFFQGMPDLAGDIQLEPTGEYRKRGWTAEVQRILFITGKAPRPPLKETFLDALRWSIGITRTAAVDPRPDAQPGYRNRANGLAAYDAWSAHLLRDEDFPASQPAVLRQRNGIHDGMVGMVAEWRWYGSLFLTRAAEPNALHHNQTEELLRAAACYAGEHALMWKLWDLAGGIGNPNAFERLADPAIRRSMVPIIQESKRKYAEAADCIERALALGPA